MKKLSAYEISNKVRAMPVKFKTSHGFVSFEARKKTKRYIDPKEKRFVDFLKKDKEGLTIEDNIRDWITRLFREEDPFTIAREMQKLV